jgi:hypothetical protein
MNTPENKATTSSIPLAYDEDWIELLEARLCEDPAAVEAFTHLLFDMKDALENGTEGVRAASAALSDGIRLAYLYTEEHKAAFQLYLLYLTGHLKPMDEPLTLLNGAIERGMAEIAHAKKPKAHKRKTRLSRAATNS